MKLTEYCIHRPVLSVVLSLILITIGFICFEKISLRYLPKISIPIITVSTDYPSASNKNIELEISTVIEKAMDGLHGLKYMTSMSSAGHSDVTLYFDSQVDLNSVAADVRENVNTISNQLPTDCKPPIVSKTNPNSQPIIYLAYFNENQSIGALTNYVNEFIIPQFNTAPGIASVRLWSSYFYALRIWLHPEMMAAKGITVQDIQNVLQKENVSVPTGKIEGNDLNYTIITDLKLHSIDEFNNLIIKNTNNQFITLKDVATVKIGSKHRNSDTIMRFFSVNNKPGVAIGIVPEQDANTLKVAEEVIKLSKHIDTQLPSGMKQIIEYNQEEFTKSSIHSIFEAIVESFLLVLLVIVLFLGNIRAAMIPILTVPICLIGSYALIYFLGYSLNAVTLLALVLAIGLVVDDAVIMLENISRYIELGDTPLKATLKGSKQITYAIISMTIIFVAIYIPGVFISGVPGVFFREFSFTLLGAILISGFVALTLSPMMCSKILTAKISQTPYNQKLKHKTKLLHIQYEFCLNFLFQKKKWVLCIGLVIVVFGYLLFLMLPQEFAPKMNMPMVNVLATLPDQNSYKNTETFIPQLSQTIKNDPSVQSYLLQVWEPGKIYAAVALKQDRHKNSYEVAQELQSKLDNIPGLKINVSPSPPPLMWFIPSNNPNALEVNILTTQSYSRLNVILQNILRQMKNNKNLTQLDTNLKWDTRQYNIKINKDLSSILNIPISTISQTLQTMFGGSEVGKYEFENQKFDIVMQLPEEDTKNINAIDKMYVHNSQGQTIPLSNLVSVTQQNEPAHLSHYNRLRSATLTATLGKNYDIGQAIKYLETTLKQILPDDTSYAFTGQAAQYLESNNSMIRTFLFALLFVFLILSAQFESFIDPFIVLLGVPFALVGALFTLKMTGNTINFYSKLAFVTLIGLIAKHGILMTEFANQQVKENIPLKEAIIKAACMRLRPILMTTCAMVLGAVPLILSSGPGCEDQKQIGLVIIGGLSFGTIITLIVVPVAYYFIGIKKKKNL